MTQPRMSTGRSSLAIALNQYYTGPRPGIALTISALALIAAVAIGVAHVVMLGGIALFSVLAVRRYRVAASG